MLCHSFLSQEEPFKTFLIALDITTNVLVLCLNAKEQVGRDFYLDAADERIWCDERCRKERHWEKKGVLLESSSWPSLHYVTEMLQHWWHREAGRRRTGPGDDVINNQSENSEANRVWPVPQANRAGSLKMSFPPLKPLSRCVLGAFFRGYF